jgi:hypothetical protein
MNRFRRTSQAWRTCRRPRLARSTSARSPTGRDGSPTPGPLRPGPPPRPGERAGLALVRHRRAGPQRAALLPQSRAGDQPGERRLPAIGATAARPHASSLGTGRARLAAPPTRPGRGAPPAPAAPAAPGDRTDPVAAAAPPSPPAVRPWRRWLPVAIAFIVAVVVITAFLCQTRLAVPPPYVIAYAGPLSGPDAGTGQEQLHAVEFAVAAANANGASADGQWRCSASTTRTIRSWRRNGRRRSPPTIGSCLSSGTI